MKTIQLTPLTYTAATLAALTLLVVGVLLGHTATAPDSGGQAAQTVLKYLQYACATGELGATDCAMLIGK